MRAWVLLFALVTRTAFAFFEGGGRLDLTPAALISPHPPQPSLSQGFGRGREPRLPSPEASGEGLGVRADTPHSPLPTPNNFIIRARQYLLQRKSDTEILLELFGNVSIEYQGRTIQSDSLVLDTANTRVLGNSPFTLLAPEGLLNGRALEYDYERQRGNFQDFFAQVQAIQVRGTRLEGDLNNFRAERVSVTTCDRTEPHFEIRADRVQLRGQRTLRLRNARLVWRGRTLLTVPEVQVNVREGTEVLSFPRPIYNNRAGLGVRTQLELPLNVRTTLAGYTTVYLRAVPEWRLVLATALRGETPILGEPDTLTRFETSPLYNLRTTIEREQNALRDRSTTLRVERQANVRPLLAPTEDLRLTRTEVALSLPLSTERILGGATVRIGEIAEREGSVRSRTYQRQSVEGELLVPLTGDVPLQARLHLWGSHTRYQGQGTYEWFRAQPELLWRPAHNFMLMVGYAESRVRGQTPLDVDRLPTRRALNARFEGTFGNLRLGILSHYDLAERDLYDLQILVGWSDHCTEPYLFWRRRQGTVLLGITLTALR